MARINPDWIHASDTRERMNRQLVRAGRLGGGTILLSIGVIGGFIPILQGWIFIIAGLTLMAPESDRAKSALEWAKSKVAGDKATSVPGAEKNNADDDERKEEL